MQFEITNEDDLAAVTTPFEERKVDRGSLITRRLSDIEAKPISWLWPGRIARGKVTLIAGNPGLGKSQIAANIAGIVTTGGKWPVCQTRCAPGNVLIFSAEDDPADTLRPRLEAAGADLGRVHFVDGIELGLKGTGVSHRRVFSMQSDLPYLEAKLAELEGISLVVIDPISAYLGGTDSHKNAEVRALLTPLGELAARYNAAIIAVSHLNKSAGMQALMRVSGSGAFVAAVRGAYLVAEDPKDKGGRLFCPLRTTLDPTARGSPSASRQLRCRARQATWKPHVSFGKRRWFPQALTTCLQRLTRNRGSLP